MPSCEYGTRIPQRWIIVAIGVLLYIILVISYFYFTPIPEVTGEIDIKKKPQSFLVLAVGWTLFFGLFLIYFIRLAEWMVMKIKKSIQR